MSATKSTPPDDPLAQLFRSELHGVTRLLQAFVDRGADAASDGTTRAVPDDLCAALRALSAAGRVMGLHAITSISEALLQSPNNARMDQVLAYLVRLGDARESPAAFVLRTSAELEVLGRGLDAAKPTVVAAYAGGEMKPVADGTLYELFAQEAERCALILGDGLVTLDTQTPTAELWDELMRATHSLKGAARVVNLGAMARLAHTLEECFIGARSGELRLRSTDVDVLLAAADAIARANTADSGRGTATAQLEANADTVTARLAALLQEGRGPARLAPEGASAPPRVEPRIVEPSAPRLTLVPPKPEAAQPIERNNRAQTREAAIVDPPKAQERVLRIAAESVNQLMGLASESLVESRRMATLSQALQPAKKHHNVLAALLESLEKSSALGSVNETSELLTTAKREVRECMRILSEHTTQLEGYTRRAEELGERLYRTALKSQMRPFGDGAHGFPRLVRDVARQLGKQVRLEIVGRPTQVDRDALDKLEAPINHLLRNAIDHGVESREERSARGKPEIALLRIEARHHAGMLSITVSDDGAGIDVEAIRAKAMVARSLSPAIAANLSRAEVFEFLFLPGFSTASAVSEISGRGVGLDVVKSSIEALGGTTRVTSKRDHGTSFHLQLPVTRSVVRAVVASVDGEAYAFPLLRIERIGRIAEVDVKTLENKRYVMIDDQPVALIDARRLLGAPEMKKPRGELSIVVVGDRKRRCGVVVDEFCGEHDIVVRPLDPRLGKVQDVAAAAVLMDGSVALIMDVDDIVRSAERMLQADQPAHGDAARAPSVEVGRKRVLVVDDSIAVREAQRQLLVNRGYLVDVAVDGIDGLNSVRRSRYDLIITDIDMPRMNGFELVRSIKQDPKLASIPVVIVSYKDRDEDRVHGLEVGASCYLSKSSFHDDTLAQAVSDLIGEAAA